MQRKWATYYVSHRPHLARLGACSPPTRSRLLPTRRSAQHFSSDSPTPAALVTARAAGPTESSSSFRLTRTTLGVEEEVLATKEYLTASGLSSIPGTTGVSTATAVIMSVLTSAGA